MAYGDFKDLAKTTAAEKNTLLENSKKEKCIIHSKTIFGVLI